MSTTIRLRTLVFALGVAVFATGTGCADIPNIGIGVAYATREPPAERLEDVPVAPNLNQVWIAGHWAWQKDDYTWTPGRWETPPSGSRTWVPGHWVKEDSGWRYMDGHWQ